MWTGESRPAPLRAQVGFGYVWMLLIVAVFGVGLAAIGELWSTQAQREREAELLRVGREFRQALTTYFGSSRPGTPAYPARLEELMEDRRGPVLRRHLRKLYHDPITGGEDWGFITAPDGRIRGIYSRSQQTPLKRARFGPGEAQFEKAVAYADWRFEHVVVTPMAAPRR